MTLLAEEIVEEWLNRQGYFTIRGIKIGVHEMDLLAVRLTEHGIDARHFEVQASINPVSYITGLPKSIQKATGRAPMSRKERSRAELEAGVAEWVEKKYFLKSKEQLRQKLYPDEWSLEFVIHKYRHQEELDLIVSKGIHVHHLKDIVGELKSGKMMLKSAAGDALVDLILLDTGSDQD